MKKMILCPICHKLIGKIEEDGEMKKVYLWCKRCKHEIYISNIKNLKTMTESEYNLKD